MPKQAVSLTLDETNLVWLRARGRGNLSAAVDEVVAAARAGGLAVPAPAESVVGTVDIAPDDPRLERADRVVRDLFAASMARPMKPAGSRTRSLRRRG